jgi:hypothetical protein
MAFKVRVVDRVIAAGWSGFHWIADRAAASMGA